MMHLGFLKRFITSEYILHDAFFPVALCHVFVIVSKQCTPSGP